MTNLGPFLVSPSEEEIYTAIRAFLLYIVSSDVEVILGNVNRVPPPKGVDFIIMWPLLRNRLETNVRTEIDVKYMGSIAGNVMTVTDISSGQIVAGNPVFGVGVADGTKVDLVLTGTGGIGTYQLNNSQTLTSQVLSSGMVGLVQNTELIIQIDIHGPNSSANAQMISTFFRDEYSIDWLNDNGFSFITPLYVDNLNQVPFDNAENQLEERWRVDARFQANIIVNAPQQYADSISVDLINVDAVYPP